jgi:hypothetical protein
MVKKRRVLETLAGRITKTMLEVTARVISSVARLTSNRGGGEGIFASDLG